MSRHEFTKAVKLAAWKRCGGYCERCTAKLFIGKFEFDHVSPTAISEDRSLFNCQVLCSACHSEKTRFHDVPAIAKSNRVRAAYLKIRKTRRHPIPGSRSTPWKKKLDGTVVRR